MNIRFEAVDQDGRAIEDNDDNLHPPLDHVQADSIPRTGEKVLFYNVAGDLADWIVHDVVWMVDVSDDSRRHGGFMHVCVQIRQLFKDGNDG